MKDIQTGKKMLVKKEKKKQKKDGILYVHRTNFNLLKKKYYL